MRTFLILLLGIVCAEARPPRMDDTWSVTSFATNRIIATNGLAAWCAAGSGVRTNTFHAKRPAGQFAADCYKAFLSRTNRSTALWTRREHINIWPTNRTMQIWNTNSLLYGLEGYSALSQCHVGEFLCGHPSFTLITPRHAYGAGHMFALRGYGEYHTGIFFCGTNGAVQMGITTNAICYADAQTRDYILVQFDHDITNAQPVTVMTSSDFLKYVMPHTMGKWVWLLPNKWGNVAAYPNQYPNPLFQNLYEPSVDFGDSGCPNLVPTPDGKLVFSGGRTSTMINDQMLRDLAALCATNGLDTNIYWPKFYDFSKYE